MRSCFSLTPWIVPAVCTALVSCGSRRADNEALDRHVNWLLGQQVPNSRLEYPMANKRHLVMSYEIPPTDPAFRYLYSKSFLYDNAIAAIALCHTGHWEEARKILLTLTQLIRNDGSLWFNYNLAVDWPTETDHDMAIVRTGAIAWAGYAYCFYLENHPRLPAGHPDRSRFTATAERIASFIAGRMARPASPSRYGPARGGYGEVNLVMSQAGSVVEQYRDRPVRWASTEHNIDVHLFLRRLYALTGKQHYRELMLRIERILLRVLWSPGHRQFFRGIRPEGVDSVLALDCASWGALFLLNAGKTKQARQAVAAIDARYRTTVDGVAAYIPYRGIPVYESAAVNAHFSPGKPDRSWGDFPFCWWEGSYGVALARLRAGSETSGRELLDGWAALHARDPGGGIPYGSMTIPFQFSQWKSVAATAWHIICRCRELRSPLPHPFFS